MCMRTLSQWSKSTPEYIPCCQNCHSYHLAQTVGHGSGSWCTRHSCTAGSISHSHQTQLQSKAMPFLQQPLHQTIPFLTLHHLSYTLCQFWVYCWVVNQREHRYFCTCQAFSASCILLTLSLASCYSFTLHLLSCWLLMINLWTFEPLNL